MGTTRVKDIRPGSMSSDPRHFTKAGNWVYFTVNSQELWRTDGTAAGTTRITTLLLPNSFDNRPFMASMGDVLYFAATDGVSGYELWKTHGTGAVRVKDILPGPSGSLPIDMRISGGALYFMTNDGVSDVDLWRSDGTEAGTVKVADLPASYLSSSRNWLTPYDGGVAYVAANGTTNELWFARGEETAFLKSSVAVSYGSEAHPAMAVAEGKLFFPARGDSGRTELWQTDGTPTGTRRVATVYIDVATNTPLVPAGDALYFVSSDPVHGRELWSITVASPASRGDFNGDGVTDGSDFLVWQRTLGRQAEFKGSGADGDESGEVDAGDLVVWQDNYGAPNLLPSFAETRTPVAEKPDEASPTPSLPPATSRSCSQPPPTKRPHPLLSP